MNTPSTRADLELNAQRAYERARTLVFNRLRPGTGLTDTTLSNAQRAALRDLELAETALHRYRNSTYGVASVIPMQVAS